MKCFLSELCEETQLGESGQGESLPSVIPRLRGLHPEQPNIIIVNKNTANTFMPLSCYREFILPAAYHKLHMNADALHLFKRHREQDILLDAVVGLLFSQHPHALESESHFAAGTTG